MKNKSDDDKPEPKRYWTGDIDNCNICKLPITTHFIDGRLTGYTTWAIMCPKCFEDYGAGLGTGRGQLYKKQPDGKYMKIKG